jgi:hypothetical protein
MATCYAGISRQHQRRASSRSRRQRGAATNATRTRPPRIGRNALRPPATRFGWTRSCRPLGFGRSQGTRLGRLDVIRPDARIRPAEEARRTVPSGLLQVVHSGRPARDARDARNQAWLSRKSCDRWRHPARGEISTGVPGAGWPPPSGGREDLVVEVEEIVRRGDQSPFRADSAASSSSEAIQARLNFICANTGSIIGWRLR